MKKNLLFLIFFSCLAFAGANTFWDPTTFKNTVAIEGVQTNSEHINLETQKAVRFQDAAGGQYVGLQAPATVSSSLTFILPNADGSNGQCIKTDGSVGLSFGDCVASASGVTVEAKTADFTAEGGYSYMVDTSLGDVTASIEAVASGTSGEEIEFKVIDGTNSLILDPDGSETIDNLSTRSYSGEDEAIKIRQDGTEWWVIGGMYTEYYSAEITSATSTTAANTLTAVTGSSITVDPGTWMICYSVAYEIDPVSSGSFHQGTVAIYNSSNALLDGSMQSPGHFFSSSTGIQLPVSNCAQSVISASETYDLGIRCSGASASVSCTIRGNASSGAFTDPDQENTIWAWRMR